MNCKYCGQALPDERTGRRVREYCNNAHKQAHYRKLHQQDQNAALLTELAELRAKVEDQAQTIEGLEQEVSRLRERLDIERRFLEDKKPRYFKSWLRKQPTSPLTEKLLADQFVPDRGPRSLYQGHVRRLLPDEMEEFKDLWKLLLLQQA